ncbi:mechanosensitive ion channel domain-containing protein [uncultured Eudoraea sp.]|jgi:small-conductance mechanosensitive channel|uniref:mechanosensitive ion channel domain-containing protein n=1 Tax=uncultured Eudoraea sp. TaxID=1035614 RepID=UPI002630D3C7|nr:mechanosensitive ion channel domain-containing protein [uncultured Eudoraea sp.]
MEEFILNHKSELLATVITLVALLVLKFILSKTIRKVGSVSDLNKVRTRLIIKYVSFGLSVVGLAVIIFIWGVNFRELGLIFSSVFAVIGVAIFAQWSILSNVTAGIILYFSFPFKIGDRIKIMDKEIEYDGNYVIEDIKAFHIHLRNDDSELLTYPNSLMLQKGVLLIN